MMSKNPNKNNNKNNNDNNNNNNNKNNMHDLVLWPALHLGFGRSKLYAFTTHPPTDRALLAHIHQNLIPVYYIDGDNECVLPLL
jgi:hypothetical protein